MNIKDKLFLSTLLFTSLLLNTTLSSAAGENGSQGGNATSGVGGAGGSGSGVGAPGGDGGGNFTGGVSGQGSDPGIGFGSGGGGGGGGGTYNGNGSGKGGNGGIAVGSGGSGGGGQAGTSGATAAGTLNSSVTGGAGGDGGDGFAADSGAGGGGGGGGYGVYVVSGNIVLNSNIIATGGMGGVGGASDASGSTVGDSGAGGDGIHLAGTNASVTLNASSQANGGAGASGVTGNHSFSREGDGGRGILLESGGSVLFADNATITGGAGGFGGNNSIGSAVRAGLGGNGGDAITIQGGSATIDLSSSAGNSIIGGNGGAGGGATANGFQNSAANGGVGGNAITLSAAGTITVNGSSTLQGGTGGAGGGANYIPGNSFVGHGGAGGDAVSAAGAGAKSITNSGTIQAGNGGAGGNADTSPLVNGNGGNGGVGLRLETATVTNTGSIIGGNGGAAGTGGTGGSAGVSGEAVQGSNIVLINSGTITAGTGANAITFASGTNTLELQAGSNITGNVVASGGANDLLALGGSGNSSFDLSAIDAIGQYRNFALFEKKGTSTWTVSNTTSATGDWIISNGTLALSTADALAASNNVSLSTSVAAVDMTAASQTLNNLVGAAGSQVLMGSNTLTVNSSVATTFAGVLSGTGGGVTKEGGSILTLNGINAYTGVTLVNAGTLELGSGGSIAASSGVNLAAANTALILTGGNKTINNLESNFSSSQINMGNNNLTVNMSANQIFAGSFVGTGGLIKGGSNILTLTNANSSYTGATIINAGTLALGAGGSLANSSGLDLVAGGSVFDITAGGNQIIQNLSGVTGSQVNLGANSMTFGTSNSTVFGGAFLGSGDLIKQGAGEFELTGNNSLFTGNTTVEDGTLRLNGILGGDLHVTANGYLAGSGTVMQHLFLEGIIAPGNSIGTLTVEGNYVQAAGSTYDVEINPAGLSDLIQVTGTATIQGGTVQVIKETGTYLPGTHYTILTAEGGLTGTYNDLTQTMPFLNLILNYDSNNVYLDIARNTTSFQNFANTPNQLSTATGLASLGAGNALYDAIVSLPDGASVPLAFNSLSGEVHASVLSVLTEDSRYLREAIFNRLRSTMMDQQVARHGLSDNFLEDNFLGHKTSDPELGFWVQGFGTQGDLEGNYNTAHVDRSTSGFFLGIDKQLQTGFRAGAMGGYSRSHFNAQARYSEGSSDNYHVGVYGGALFPHLAMRAGGAYSWHTIDIQRYVSFPGFSSSLDSNYDGNSEQAFVEVATPWNIHKLSVEPFAHVAYVNVDNDAFNEQGSLAGLNGTKSRSSTVYSTLGLRENAPVYEVGKVAIQEAFMVGWQHNYSRLSPLSTFSFNGGLPFLITGTPIAQNSLVLDAGIDFTTQSNLNLRIAYIGQVSHAVKDNGVTATLSYKG